ncbi:uncharacterized protein SCHCODRAFT_02350880 [Schizophyllum commune H4-8]|uniref:uncharacterized protein n=1 Tax=Schizophyllum commune (strain H4-8 / FGSC 9210) TaxID=578458 RepID=UPI0021601485|nr:uncharacterized protein SCHCODRAFT_02350880 [Schizophyllum commune H4-8]KAI5890677.1 hypothetical protein SCHCODRAFT_02350880 [Schizophyllum commune H4-8]
MSQSTGESTASVQLTRFDACSVSCRNRTTRRPDGYGKGRFRRHDASFLRSAFSPQSQLKVFLSPSKHTLPMHLCLAVPEIMILICDVIQESGKYDGTLAALATCCRAFYMPAVSALWRDLNTLMPLLLSLPHDLWSTENEGHRFVCVLDIPESNTLLTLVKVASRPVKPKDLQRFFHYTSMVRTLRVSWLPDATCHAALELSCPTPLLPNLRRLEWGLDASSQRFHQILFFLSPTIVCLHLHIPSAVHALSLLPRLPILCPGVRDVRLQGIMRNTAEDQLDLVSNAVCQWEGLQVVSMPHLSNEDLPRLASVPELAELTLYCPHSGVQEIPRVGRSAFLALRSLSICPTFMEYGVLLIRAIPKLRLHRLSITFFDTNSWHEWSSIIAAIISTCDRTTLSELDIDESAEYDIEQLVAAGDTSPWPRAFDYRTMQLLVSFTALTDLSLVCWGGFLLNDAEIHSLAQAWPQLVSLKLRAGRIMRPFACTLCALISFAQCCPHLRHLALDLDACSPAYEQTDKHGARQRTLRYLDVDRSPIKSAIAVAAFITTVFPDIQVLKFADTSLDPEVDDPEAEDLDEEVEEVRATEWGKVERLLPLSGFRTSYE